MLIKFLDFLGVGVEVNINDNNDSEAHDNNDSEANDNEDDKRVKNITSSFIIPCYQTLQHLSLFLPTLQLLAIHL